MAGVSFKAIFAKNMVMSGLTLQIGQHLTNWTPTQLLDMAMKNHPLWQEVEQSFLGIHGRRGLIRQAKTATGSLESLGLGNNLDVKDLVNRLEMELPSYNVAYSKLFNDHTPWLAGQLTALWQRFQFYATQEE